MSKIISLILVFITSSCAHASSPKLLKNEVSFSTFWTESKYIAEKYRCEFDKTNNPSFEFLFVVLNVESSTEVDISDSTILANESQKLLEDKGLEKQPVNTLKEILCVTDSSAIVLHTFITQSKSKHKNYGAVFVAQYDFVHEGDQLKLKIYEDASVHWFRMSRTLESTIFTKIKLESLP